MTKIAFISDAIWPYNKGGKEKRLFDISTRLSQDNFDVHIYTMKWWAGPNITKENGVTLHAISKLYPLYSGDRRSIKEGVLFGLSCLRLITEDWDVIDVDHMPFFPLFFVKLVCLLKRKKMIATWHEVWGKEYWKEYLGKSGGIAYLVEKLAVLMPDIIISVSEHTYSKLKGNLLSKKEIIIVPDGIDLSHIQELKPSLNKSDVIFAGRLLSHKNVDVLIKSIAILKDKNPNIKCLIIGDGPEKIALEKLSESLDLKNNVKFLGFIENHDEVLSLIKSSKVFVLPSTREGFGIVVIEANACGIPVMTIDNEANAAKDLIVQDKNGYLCRLNEREIAVMVGELITVGKKNVTSKACVDLVKKYDWKEIIKEIKEVYSK